MGPKATTLVFEVEVHVTRASSFPHFDACFVVMGPKAPTLVFEVEVHVTRASSFPKIKARFHILMLVSWLWDQKHQLWFLRSKFTLLGQARF